MDSDVLYAVLMSFGWLFLLGWLALLLIACLLAFRSEGDSEPSSPQSKILSGHPAILSAAGRSNIRLRG
jgi:hypothetical protein